MDYRKLFREALEADATHNWQSIKININCIFNIL